ncbi:MAG: hypothetical protein PHX44_05515 [Sulfurimonas sp.]|uniref:hypothetical protein n=1 Tax=Sulfurimonas sp. TaxID=2022749 RepID=UPI00260A43BC|nr:hypothetical protein [Sulfurimonas sp.]MDD2652488.1 hypothetical protein [Sulfurimonas sp.]MDD3452225.1 hypothetical protein [Sulfurimonas sp.]
MRSRLTTFLFLIFALNLLFLFYYQTFVYRAFFNSDAAIANILAQEIISQGSYYPQSWWYVNGDIWTFFKHTPALLFTLLGLHAYDVHTLTVISFFLFSLWFTFSYLKRIGIASDGILIALIGLSTLYSPMYIREVLGESAYIWYYSAMIGYLYALWLMQKREKPLLAAFLIVAISLFFVAENPSRFAIYFLAPLFAPFVLFHEHIELRYKKFLLYLFAGLAAGIIYRYFILQHIQMHTGAEKTFLIAFEELPQHIWRSFGGLWNFYGGLWRDKAPFVSFDSVITLLKLLCTTAIFFVPMFYALRNKDALTPFERYTIALGYSGFFIILGIYALTSLHSNGLYAAKENIRYIIPFVLFIAVNNGILWKFFSKRVKFLLMFSILLSYLSIQNTLQGDVAAKIIQGREEVIQTLLENNATKGYAPYWHSHIFTVLSDSKVEIRPLEDQNYKREVGTWLSSSAWYDKTDRSASFILMPSEKIEPFERATKEHNLSEPTKTITLERYKIYFFDTNPITN